MERTPGSLPRAAAVLAAIGLWIAPCATAGGGPEHLAVVVNAESWASLAVANSYIRLRGIPACNVVHLTGVGGHERIPVEAFRSTILTPVLTQLSERGLAGQIDAIAYSSDFPYAIDARGDTRGRTLPKQLAPWVALTGATFLYQLVQARNAAYIGLDTNFYMRQAVRIGRGQQLTAEQGRRLQAGRTQLTTGNAAAAYEQLSTLAEEVGAVGPVIYWQACAAAAAGDPAGALGLLRRAALSGWYDVHHTSRNPALAALHKEPAFRAVLGQMQRRMLSNPISRAFSGRVGWSAQGQPVPPGKGMRHLLSTMLAVTSGRGTSVREAIAGLTRSVAADGTRPSGPIYYMDSGDVRARTRQWGFDEAVRLLRGMGQRALRSKGQLPEGAEGVAGAMLGSPTFDWLASGSRIQPGAIVEHLTSLGGVLSQGGGQTPLTALLRAGAAGASGTVSEPYAIQAKFPTPFIHVHYVRGCTLAEAFYQSVQGPYQLLIVGDPLCAPWARPPSVAVLGVSDGQTLSGRVTLRPTGERAAIFALYAAGRRRAICRPGGVLRLDTTTLVDGAHELRVEAIGADAIAATARQRLRCVIDNRGRRATLVAPTPAVALGQPIPLVVQSPAAQEIRIVHGARVVGRVRGPQGRLDVDSMQVGPGPVRLRAEAVHGADGAVTAVSAPVEVTVGLPPMRAARAPTPGLRPGLLLEVPGRPPHVVESTRRAASWLRKAGVGRGTTFRLSGELTVPGDDVYQLQVSTSDDMQLRIAFDGVPLTEPRTRGWRYLPVALAGGSHTFTLTGTGSPRLLLDLRFGGSGTRSLDSTRFRHRPSGG